MTATRIIIPEEIQSTIRAAACRGESAEQLSQRMADLGLEKVPAIKLLRDNTAMDLGEAKEFIHYSPAWAFRRASDEAFHDQVFKSAFENGWVEVEAQEKLKTSA